MKKINDNTLVKVRVPKHLYEAVKARIAMLEDKRMEEAEKVEKPKKEKAQPGGSTGTYLEGNLNESERDCVKKSSGYYIVDDEHNEVSGPYHDSNCTRRKK